MGAMVIMPQMQDMVPLRPAASQAMAKPVMASHRQPCRAMINQRQPSSLVMGLILVVHRLLTQRVCHPSLATAVLSMILLRCMATIKVNMIS